MNSAPARTRGSVSLLPIAYSTRGMRLTGEREPGSFWIRGTAGGTSRTMPTGSSPGEPGFIAVPRAAIAVLPSCSASQRSACGDGWPEPAGPRIASSRYGSVAASATS